MSRYCWIVSSVSSVSTCFHSEGPTAGSMQISVNDCRMFKKDYFRMYNKFCGLFQQLQNIFPSNLDMETNSFLNLDI